MKKSYWIGWMSEICHHNWGSDCASYSVSDGRFDNLSFQAAVEKFKELISSQDYCELILFDDQDKIIKSWSYFQ